MNIKEANQKSLLEILERLNIKQTSKKGDDIWYLSPFRNEKTPSFHIKSNQNIWYDFGAGKGGDCVSFAAEYLKSNNEECTVSDALRWIKNMTGGIRNIGIVCKPTEKRDPAFTLKCKTPINSLGLTNYLDKRGIPLNIAKRYLSEIYFENKKIDKHYYALGFKNIENGYEFRNPIQKGCVGLKAISFVRGSIPKPEEIHLFEGFFDFLSVITKLNGKSLNGDAIVLNSVSMIGQVYPYIKSYGYKIGYSWFDNDEAGIKTQSTLSEIFQIEKIKHIQMNSNYKNFKDVNDWLVNSPKSSLTGA